MCWPRATSVITLIPFGIEAKLDSSFRSKWLVNQLMRFGFSFNVCEVATFKQLKIQQMKILRSKKIM